MEVNCRAGLRTGGNCGIINVQVVNLHRLKGGGRQGEGDVISIEIQGKPRSDKRGLGGIGCFVGTKEKTS